MQVSELMFLAVLAVAIVRLLIGSRYPQLSYLRLLTLGLVVALAGLMLEGFRWQMLPAYGAFALLCAGVLRSAPAPLRWRVVGSLPLLILLSASSILTVGMPVFTYPEPAGPYAVGTFDYSVTDPQRPERYQPDRSREIYIEAWYPADPVQAPDYPVTSLYHEIYEGEPYWLGVMLSYLKHVPTNSHINAPLAEPEVDPFPVLVFSHGAMAYTSQNQQLMEHLASHGYVIFSVGHTYDATIVNLADGGSVRRATKQPADLPFQLEEMERNILGKIRNDANIVNDVDISPVRAQLLALADEYSGAVSMEQKYQITSSAIADELAPFAHLMTPESLGQYLDVLAINQYSIVDYRVADLKLALDSADRVEFPVSGLAENLDLTRVGVFGMSAGGATAGEFCKTDARCIAGSNLDGTQFGRHWSTPVPVPFLMFYHETHQGGNDFAYLPAVADYFDYGVKGTTHFDFAEMAHTFPFLRWASMTGEIDKKRMIDILNEVQLNFFDRYLKGRQVPENLFEDIPEINIRENGGRP